MSKYYTLNTKVSLRKGGRTILKMSELEFAEKAKKFILDTCKEDSWVTNKISNTDNTKKIISYLPSAIREVYWNDKKGKTTIKKDFKGITPDWENYDMVGGLRNVKGAPYIIMSVGGDWECPICIMVYHDGKQFRCYIPEKGNAYRKDTKTLFGNYDDSYNSETGEYEDEIKSKKLKKTIPSDDKYAFDQLVKDGILDKEKDIDKKKGLGRSIEYNTDMCIEDFSSRVELKESYNFDKKLDLYESIMKNISKTVKNALNEYNVLGVEVDSLTQLKMSDIDDTDKPVQWQDRDITKNIQGIFDKMKNNFRFKNFLADNNVTDTIQWSYKVSTACTDGFNGRIIMNPDFMKKTLDNAGELGVLFIILHETMHNYYNNVKHAQKITTPADNIIIDRRINKDIIMKWPEFRTVPEQIGALL